MQKVFFGFDSLNDIWGKVLRDLESLRQEESTDTIFNFFVTAYSVMDYVKRLLSLPKAAIEEMYGDDDFKLCGFVANKGKHLELWTEPGHDTHYDSNQAAAGCSYAVIVEDRRIPVWTLAVAVIERWRRFFRENGIQVDDSRE